MAWTEFNYLDKSRRPLCVEILGNSENLDNSGKDRVIIGMIVELSNGKFGANLDLPGVMPTTHDSIHEAAGSAHEQVWKWVEKMGLQVKEGGP